MRREEARRLEVSFVCDRRQPGVLVATCWMELTLTRLSAASRNSRAHWNVRQWSHVGRSGSVDTLHLVLAAWGCPS